MCREHGLARPEGQPRQRYANVVQIAVRNPQFRRAFRQVRKSAAILRSRTLNSNYVACSNSLCEINLMISSFLSGHGHRGLLATGGAPQEAGSIACDATSEEEYGFSRTCNGQADEVLQSARSKDADGSWAEKVGITSEEFAERTGAHSIKQA
jgi:hypothetical protein